MNYYGAIIGFAVFAVIGLFHPIVIKCEYRFSKKIWPVFLIAGAGLVIGSFFIKNYVISTLLSVVGFACFWSIHELYAQERRVEKGWFPKNPKRSGLVPETKFELKDVVFAEKTFVKDCFYNIARLFICVSGLVTFVMLAVFAPAMRSEIFFVIMGIHSFFFIFGIERNLGILIDFRKRPHAVVVCESVFFVKHRGKYIRFAFSDIGTVNILSDSRKSFRFNSESTNDVLLEGGRIFFEHKGSRISKKIRNASGFEEAICAIAPAE